MGSPRCSRLTNFARLLLPCLWMAANGYNIFRFTLRVGRYPRNNQPLAMNQDRSFLIGFDRRNLYGSLFWTNSTIKFLSFGNKLVNLDAFFFSKMRRSIHQRWMLEPIFGGLNLIKMDLGGLFLKDHLLRIDSIHQK